MRHVTEAEIMSLLDGMSVDFDALYASVFADDFEALIAKYRVDPSRAKALQTCRTLKDIATRPTTIEGERANAQAAMARLMAKHGIAESEI